MQDSHLKGVLTTVSLSSLYRNHYRVILNNVDGNSRNKSRDFSMLFNKALELDAAKHYVRVGSDQ